MTLQLSNCRSCDARIIWIVTESGKRMPVDAKPAGKFIVLNDDDPPKGSLVPGYVSHFATCPQAADWRGKETTNEPAAE
jgi:hypothetical protein